MKEILPAAKEVFSLKKNWFYFIGICLFIFGLFVMLPVWTTPGNDILFQLSLFELNVYVLLISLAVLNAYLLTMHIRAHQLKAALHIPKSQKASGLGILTTSLAATIGCASCYSSILAIFGIGGTAFIVSHRWWFAAIAITLSLFAIWSTSKKINGHCASCSIDLSAIKKASKK